MLLSLSLHSKGKFLLPAFHLPTDDLAIALVITVSSHTKCVRHGWKVPTCMSSYMEWLIQSIESLSVWSSASLSHPLLYLYPWCRIVPTAMPWANSRGTDGNEMLISAVSLQHMLFTTVICVSVCMHGHVNVCLCWRMRMRFDPSEASLTQNTQTFSAIKAAPPHVSLDIHYIPKYDVFLCFILPCQCKLDTPSIVAIMPSLILTRIDASQQPSHGSVLIRWQQLVWLTNSDSVNSSTPAPKTKFSTSKEEQVDENKQINELTNKEINQ